jgi:hypothetical protein
MIDQHPLIRRAIKQHIRFAVATGVSDPDLSVLNIHGLHGFVPTLLDRVSQYAGGHDGAAGNEPEADKACQ